MKKKTILITGCILVTGVSLLAAGWLYSRNRKMSGIIKNQNLQIQGLMKEVKNLSYHLGKANT